MFGRATIRLGIGPHSSHIMFFVYVFYSAHVCRVRAHFNDFIVLLLCLSIVKVAYNNVNIVNKWRMNFCGRACRWTYLRVVIATRGLSVVYQPAQYRRYDPVFVCLSARLSVTSRSSLKWLNLVSRKQNQTIAKVFSCLSSKTVHCALTNFGFTTPIFWNAKRPKWSNYCWGRPWGVGCPWHLYP